jgi:tol-pal system protein YbgF
MQYKFAKCFVAVLFCGAALANAQAPIIDASQPAGSRNKATATATGGGSAVGDLVMQVQSLQQEVMELRGIVEEQAHQIDTLRQQGLDRYNDLDKRISSGSAGAATSVPLGQGVPESTLSGNSIEPAAAPVNAAAIPTAPAAGGMAVANPQEYEAFQVAFVKLKAQDFPGAIKGFNEFIAKYPSSSLTPNAYYWLGKAYLLQAAPDSAKAQTAFTKVVGDHPQNDKAPDALYELGKISFQKGDKAKAKAQLQQVIDNYGASGSRSPQLAKQFLDQNFAAAKR